MENPAEEGNEEVPVEEVNDVSARFKMPAQRKTPVFSVKDKNDEKEEESARFQILAQRKAPGLSDTAQSQMLAQNSVHGNRIEIFFFTCGPNWTQVCSQ